MSEEGEWTRRTKLKTQITISAVVLGASLFIVLWGGYDDSYSKWAFGMVGLVVGYWLK